MKTSLLISIGALLLAAVVAIYPSTARAASESPSELLEKGIYNGETKGDLDSAIAIYQQLIAEANINQSLAAQAQFRLGQCYLKKNRSAEATEAFEKLIHDFPNEKERIANARQYVHYRDTGGMTPANILTIEDDAAILRVMKDNFVARGYRVQTARNREEGLDAALNSGPDLIILDIMLPKINGFEISRAVRAEKLEMPILMLTAKGQEEDIVCGLELGADDYITKPFSVRELMTRARAFLRRRQARAAPSYEFGRCRLDIVSHRLLKGGVEVPLTNKEFRLLEFFLQRPGRALTRDSIMNAVWGNSVMVTARSVDRCITTLRSKIEPDPHHPTFIHTIREIGYRFEA